MAAVKTVLKVFVAAPGDVNEERNCIEGVIKELNKTISGHKGILLVLVSWETDVYPAVGVDAQDVINEQIGDDVDILVGIMWTRFGTPTGRSGSGTAEEFDRAFERHQVNPNQLKLMWYFKDGLIAPSKVDHDQLGRVNKFKEKLGELGVLYKTFTNRDEFEQMLRINLSEVVLNYGKTWGNVPNATHGHTDVSEVPEPTPESMTLPVDDTEEGFLDLVADGLKHWETFSVSLGRITAATQDLGTITEEKTKELNSSKSLQGEFDVQRTKQIIDEVADAMDDFAVKTGAEIQVFSTSFADGLTTVSKSVALMEDFRNDDQSGIVTMADALDSLDQTIYDNIDIVRNFRNTIAATPRATTKYNQARKRVVATLDILILEHQSAHNLAVEAKHTLQSILDRLSDTEDN